jgi:hypothetical protein
MTSPVFETRPFFLAAPRCSLVLDVVESVRLMEQDEMTLCSGGSYFVAHDRAAAPAAAWWSHAQKPGRRSDAGICHAQGCIKTAFALQAPFTDQDNQGRPPERSCTCAHGRPPGRSFVADKHDIYGRTST